MALIPCAEESPVQNGRVRLCQRWKGHKGAHDWEETPSNKPKPATFKKTPAPPKPATKNLSKEQYIIAGLFMEGGALLALSFVALSISTSTVENWGALGAFAGSILCAGTGLFHLKS